MSVQVPVDSADLNADLKEAIVDGLAANFAVTGVMVSQVVLFGGV